MAILPAIGLMSGRAYAFLVPRDLQERLFAMRNGVR
jgi:hypothetical protein